MAVRRRSNRAGIFTFELQGFKELDAALAELPKSMGKAALKKALVKAAEPVIVEARRLVPKRSGRLAASIIATDKLGKTEAKARQRAGFMKGQRSAVTVRVGPSARKRPYGHLIEFGTAPHSTAKGARTKKGTLQDKPPFHPGSAPRPFMRPAWDGKRFEALEQIKAELWKELAKAAQRLARRAAKGTLSKAARRHLGG